MNSLKIKRLRDTYFYCHQVLEAVLLKLVKQVKEALDANNQTFLEWHSLPPNPSLRSTKLHVQEELLY